MNYITEILCFQNFNRNQTLSAGQISLWHALFAASNRQGLGQPFSVSDKMLQTDSGLSESGVRKAREALCRQGLVQYKKPSGRRGDRGIYQLTCMEEKMSRKESFVQSDDFFLTAEPGESKEVPKRGSCGKGKGKGSSKGKGKGQYKKKKTKQTKQEKKKRAFGPCGNVLLTEEELERLQKQFPDWEHRIRQMSLYMESTGKQYQSCYAALVLWAEQSHKREGSDRQEEGDRQLLQTIANRQLQEFRQTHPSDVQTGGDAGFQ